jgi:peptidoglycan/xylan/chitin deacetylase (PgdA/CDA1 family)
MLQDWISVMLLVVAIACGLIAITIIPAGLIKHAQRVRLGRLCKGHLLLTYDDGPGPELTPPLLDVLRRHGAKATFFLVGFRSHSHPELCEQITRAGHEIGTHTYQHRDAWLRWPWSAVRDVNRGYEEISRWSVPNAPFRAPFGKLTLWTWLATRFRSAPLSWWTIDSGDTHARLPDPALIIHRLVQANGGVVLLHSHDRDPQRERYVIDVTERLLKAARSCNMKVCTVSELIAPPSHVTSHGEGYVREA